MTDTVNLPVLLANPDALAAAPDLASHPSGDHGIDQVIGYVVRQTCKAGTVLPEKVPGRLGIDVFVLDGVQSYATAFEFARGMRVNGSYAIVDMVYVCGCRS
jgi:hypothetical protein